ncbi:hypothetical protein [Sediminispirochaeta bajacaliforniensis]|uniref:hypothetical protein n=1 Tax=Sediminispirochaeta bajacaliforniensis TaxID=148 RepID=UPI000372AC58|nr:hypothetical protein [Sediminispirochaeta bajacaliforniensis]
MALREKTIGYDRLLKNDLLNKVAYFVGDGNNPEDVKSKLRASFEDQTSDALRKTINLLMGIWSTVPEEIVPLRDQAIKLFLKAYDSEKRIIHYFMSMANYPFFFDVCLLTGRALRLSNSFTSRQILTKIQEKWGDRSTTIRAVQRTLKTIEQWGWLNSTKQRDYSLNDAGMKTIIPKEWHGFIANCVLFGSLRSSMLIEEITQNPSLFPFHIEFNIHEMKQWNGIRLEQRGRGDLLVSLK